MYWLREQIFVIQLFAMTRGTIKVRPSVAPTGAGHLARLRSTFHRKTLRVDDRLFRLDRVHSVSTSGSFSSCQRYSV